MQKKLAVVSAMVIALTFGAGSCYAGVTHAATHKHSAIAQVQSTKDHSGSAKDVAQNMFGNTFCITC